MFGFYIAICFAISTPCIYVTSDLMYESVEECFEVVDNILTNTMTKVVDGTFPPLKSFDAFCRTLKGKDT